MQNYFLFTNVLGSYAFGENLSLVEKGNEKSLAQKYKAQSLPKEKIRAVLHHFKRSEHFSVFREKNIEITKQKIRESVNEDSFIVQSINSIEELNKITNMLVKRLREWYELYLPEFSRHVQDHEKFVELILKKSRDEILKEMKISKTESMGGNLQKEDINAMIQIAEKLKGIYELKQQQEKYLESIMKKYCPNMTAIAGSLIGAKLLSLAGSLKRLAMIPSSTIQLLGAEKALFRHLKTGARSPKHGIIVQHAIFAGVKRKDYGKVARLLADKISIAARVDLFKGKYIGSQLLQEIEKKIEAGNS